MHFQIQWFRTTREREKAVDLFKLLFFICFYLSKKCMLFRLHLIVSAF